MGIFGGFKNLWHKRDERSFTSSRYDALPTTHPVPLPIPTLSARKERTSMVHILRQRYRRYRTSSDHVNDATTEISTFSSCVPSRLVLDFDDDDLENSSLVEFFQNYNMPGAASIFGMNIEGLPLFCDTSLTGDRAFLSDFQTEPALQNCPICEADITESSNTVAQGLHQIVTPLAQPEEHESEDEMGSIGLHDKPKSEIPALFSKVEEDVPATCTPCTNGSTSTSCTDVTDVSEEETVLERHQWDVIEQITDESLMQLLRDAINQKPTSNVSLDNCSIDSRFHGGYNHVVMMSAIVNKRVKQYVVRIPAIGTRSRWREGDAHNMRCEVSLMKYMRFERVLSVPKIVSFSDTLDTAIGAPFILMKLMRGRPAQMIWYDEPGNRNYETTAKVTPETEVKRRNFLRSLAFQMSKLEYLRFDKIGMPDFTETLTTGAKPKVTCAYRWKSSHGTKPEDLESDDQIYEYGPFDSSEEYTTAGIDEAWPNTHSADFDDYPDTENMIFGVRKILDLLYSHPLIASSTIAPLSTDEPETFVLSHPDLDLQNILTDDKGNVTGIIDWEGCTTMPRCAGYSAVPDFLRRYWVDRHKASDMPHMDWQVEKYAQIYTDAMREFSPKGAVYTRKSAMYDAILRAVAEGNAIDLCQKLFKCIPAMRGTDADTFNQLIGRGCEEAEAFIKQELEKLLAPDDSVES
ncbi:hypothetical protein N0V87_003689 [Didymella glomerata]|uniref:Aminoglycoside phosphotransferase domain-containing protein n=1 Tax=Didymella glomerata TaxID=749621 RepID=A0A9W8X397_9PLEO|nr:hypothetical protein N0V87_003689 [Didymella glomerata]